jgi:hypothetical protein
LVSVSRTHGLGEFRHATLNHDLCPPDTLVTYTNGTPGSFESCALIHPGG